MAEDAPREERESVDARERIFRVIRESPGAHVREIERLSGFGYGAVEYHLRRLEAAGAVRVVAEGNQKTYFAADFPKAMRPLAALVRREPLRRILVALLSYGKLTHQELGQVADMSPSTLSHHVKKLTGKGIVKPEAPGRGAPLLLADPGAIERALVSHGPGIADPALQAYIETWNEWRRPPAPPKGAPDPEEAPD